MRLMVFCLRGFFLAAVAGILSGPAIVLKDTSSTVEYAGITLTPETSIFIEFFGSTLQGRLFYAENSNLGTFISLKLVRPGILRLEMKLTATNQSHQFIILSSPLNRTSGFWHSIELRITLQQNLAVLIVDGKNAYPVHLSEILNNSTRYSFGDSLHVGRLPKHLIEDASKVVHFTAAMESAFVGNIRSIFVNGKAMQPVRALNGAEIAPGLSYCYQWKRSSMKMSRNDFICPHTALCLDGSDGLRCGCTEASAKLGLCQFQPDRPNFVFDGTAWVRFIPVPVNPNHAAGVSVHLKTKEPNGLVFWAGDAKISFIVYLLNGSMHFQLRSQETQTLGSTQKHSPCDSPYNTCSDGNWHQVAVSFSEAWIQVQVDGDSHPVQIPEASLRHHFKSFQFGGVSAALQRKLQIENFHNFTGCFQHIFYKTADGHVDLIDVVHSNLSTDTIHSQIGQVHHESVALELCPVAQRVRRNAHSRSTMVTFVRPGGYLRSQHGWKTVSAGKIAFKIRTLKLNCLLLFSSSEWPVTEKKAVLSRDRPIHPINPVDRLMGKDHFSVELREGYLVLLINTGSGINEFATDDIWRGNGRRSSWFVADGRAHQVEIQLTNGTVIVRLDGQMQNMSPKKQPRYTVLNLNGHLYIGGLSEELRTSAPPQVWSARLREDFVGCLGDLFVDGMLLDLELETTAYWAKGYAQVGESTLTSPDGACSTLQKACFPGECLRMSWVEPVCDCTNTNYAGTNCKQESHVLTFNGYQGIRVQLSLLPQQSEAESLILRFQTSQQDALLFESSSATSTAPDRFSVQILNGRIVVFYNLGAETRRYDAALIDVRGQWHTLKIIRRSKRLEITVDNATSSHNLQDGASMLDSDFACIGSITSDVPVYGNGIQKTAFVGRLSQLNLNGLDLIRIIGGTAAYRAKESIHNPHDSHLVTLLSTWKENFEVTAVSANAERIRAFPLQFQGDGGLLTYSLNQEACVSVSFAMKTSAVSGIVLIVMASKNEFVGLEIFEAKLCVIYKFDSLHHHSVVSKSILMNDTQWHEVLLYLCIDDIPSLMIEVDGVKFVPKDLAGSLTVPRHAPDKLYFGGLPQEHTRRLRNYFRSSHGYDGCFADLNVTQKSIQETSNKAEKSNVRVFQHPVNSHRITQEARGIKLGCKFPQKQAIDKIWNVNSAPTICQPGLCGFGGRCVQQLDTYYCDCSMSGFSGPVCTDVATAIRYSGNGCAVFEFNPMRNTSRDAISFGLQTLRKSPATLLHITSHSNSLDFLRLEITPFRERLVLRLTYNMGSGIQTIQEPNVDLSDGMFHVVRVIRDNAHLQLQVDSGKVINATTKGSNGSHFNEIYQVHVGCDPIKVPTVTGREDTQMFFGHINGVNYNGIFLADLLLGETISGIFYKKGSEILIDPTFTPKIRQISNLPANDMGAEQPFMSSSKPLSPLVVAKPNCFEADTAFRSKLANCRPINPHGIVIPTWSLPPLKESTRKEIQDNIWNPKESWTMHHQTQTFADIDGVDAQNKLFPFKSEDTLPLWSHDRAPQDDAVRSHVPDNGPSLEEISDGTSDEHMGVPVYLPSLNTWILLSTCGTAFLIITFLIGYAVYKFHRRNEGSYNVEEDRTIVNQRSVPAVPAPLVSTSLDSGTELTSLQRHIPIDSQSPNKEWYV